MDDPSAHGVWRTVGTVNGDNAASDNGTLQHTDTNSHANGQSNGIKSQSDDMLTAPELPPPEITHITQGFFPLAKGINRVVVQCWNDLLHLLSELGDAHPNHQGGSSSSNASSVKKSQILEFAQAKRAEFIKLLVLSQWGRQAVDVGRLIDLQFFIRQRYDLFNLAIFLAGNIKRDLFKAQMGNPDLETALEALSTGAVSALPAAIELARSHWGNNLRIELLHRTLVIQYWTNRAGPKSWIEIGTRRNKSQRRGRSNQPGIPRLYVRWIRDNKEVSIESTHFEDKIISVETILRRTISRHIHDIFFEVYTKLTASKLYGQGVLFLGLNTSATEPGNCYLDIQLTRRKTMRVTIEPVGGIVALRTVPLSLNRHDVEPDPNKALSVGTYERICRLRCLVAMEEAESHGRVVGWKLIAPANVDMQSLRKVLPVNEIRNISLFQHGDWDPNWLVAFTSSIERDDWWVIQLRDKASATESQPQCPSDGRLIQLQQAHAITGQCGYASNKHRYRSFAKLANSISGMVVAHSNADCLSKLKLCHFPKVEYQVLGVDNEVPATSVCYKASDLPHQLRVASPLSSKGKAIIKDTIYLSYKGINHRTREAIVVATGFFAVPVSHLGMDILASDSNLSFKPRSRKFAIRFLTRTGVPIIEQLFSWLQRLTNTVLALGFIYRKKFAVTSISSSKISFTYPSSSGSLRASISFQYIDTPPPLLLPDNQQAKIKGDKRPLTRLRMSLDLHGKNPHRRIMESLTAILNDPSAGLGFTLELLTLTLPLLEAVETILAESRDRSRAVVRIAARSAKMYHISYPFLQYRFHLTMKQRRQRISWLLRNGTIPSVRMSQVALESELTNKILKVNGDGWRGLGDGAMAEADNPVSLIMVLDNIIKTHVAQQRTQAAANGAGKVMKVDGNQSNAAAASLSNSSSTSQPAAVTATSTTGVLAPNSESDISKQANNGSVITID
ncbi:hypothetical protein TESG_06027 [Trichophyton tonsurans CBS 112818]|uniref:Mediator of RNA polymerase II transcription subunit 14 n=1 Tax=Trichophyton tonsurans (strain CBS 112818) TaxID=647933 RepID=F2S5A1_TRIT1|nr:hypothetical protein TESG_06027 [Trichophyton tonsurans CBS 112818]